MRTGRSQQAIVKTFHIHPYMVKQQAMRSGLPYTENAKPAFFLKIYSQINHSWFCLMVFTTLAPAAQISYPRTRVKEYLSEYHFEHHID